MKGLDPRVTPARLEVAAATLRGVVEARRFAEGIPARVGAEVLDLRTSPRADASLSTQLLHGEAVTVFDEAEGWSFVQAEQDGYVGYCTADGLAASASADRRVVVNATFVYPAPDMKRPVLGALPLDARVAAAEQVGAFLRIPAGYVWAAHLAPIEARFDFVGTAERFVGTPYLWGGKSARGIDCSGLVQLAASLAGHPLPRDTDMQEDADGLVDVDPAAPRRRGDLVFWRGHVGIMSDSASIVHASGHDMLVVRESAAQVTARIAGSGTQLRSVKRPPWIVTQA